MHELSGLTIPDVLLRVVDPTSDETDGAAATRRAAAGCVDRAARFAVVHAFRPVGSGRDGRQPCRDRCQESARRAAGGGLSSRDVGRRFGGALRAAIAVDGRKQVAKLFGDDLPRRLIEALLIRAGVPLDRRSAELSKAERSQLLDQIKKCEIRLTGTRGFEKAEVTAGGVALDEVDSRDMQSKLVPNLYLAGEILDLDGFIGGYNFQAAFSTGWLAGDNV